MPLPAGPERIDEHVDPGAGRRIHGDAHHVEARRGALQPVPGQVIRGHHREPPLFLHRDRRRRIAEIATAPGLHFDEHDAGPLAGDQVDLAEPGAVAPREDAVAAGFESAAGGVFAVDPERLPRVGHARARARPGPTSAVLDRGQAFVEDPHGGVGLRLAQYQWWREPYGVAPGAEDQHAAGEALRRPPGRARSWPAPWWCGRAPAPRPPSGPCRAPRR